MIVFIGGLLFLLNVLVGIWNLEKGDHLLGAFNFLAAGFIAATQIALLLK